MVDPIENFFSVSDAEGTEALLEVMFDSLLADKDNYDSEYLMNSLQTIRSLVKMVKHLEPKEVFQPKGLLKMA